MYSIVTQNGGKTASNLGRRMEKGKTKPNVIHLHADLDIENLEGTILGQWRVTARFSAGARTLHSVGYTVQHQDGRLGFLKALDFAWYHMSPNPAEEIAAAAQAFLDELRLLELTKARGAQHVVRVYEHGIIRQSSTTRAPIQYLFCELAECDARARMHREDVPMDGSAMRVAHHAAAGLRELHSVGITYQDMQPANVLCFPENLSKLGDLGRAVDPATLADHVEHDIPGDEAFAPPELLYQMIDPNFAVRRIGADLYLLGSLVVSLLTGSATTPLVQAHLSAELRAFNWRGTYDEVLPYIKHAFYDVLDEIEKMLVARQVESKARASIRSLISELLRS